jgi:predicted phosphodiesterase
MTATRDLGVLEGPVLVFGGPYSNLAATRALFAEAGRLGIPRERIICTGDIVAYCGEPAETVALVRESGIPVLMGNVEESLADDAEDCGCGFEEDTACARLSVDWYAFARGALDADAKAWMRALPRRIAFTLAGRELAVIHGGAVAINRFIFPSTPAGEKRAELALTGGDGIVAGHSGLPFAELVGGRLWLNAGVIGMPANDGTPRGWYALLIPRARAIRVAFFPLAYDHGATARTMAARGLKRDYAEALSTGFWPSIDVLPLAERRVRGRALTPPDLIWPAARAAAAVPSLTAGA